MAERQPRAAALADVALRRSRGLPMRAAGEGLFKVMGLVDMPVAQDSRLLQDGCLMAGTHAAAGNETDTVQQTLRFPRWPGDDWGAAAKARWKRRKALGLPVGPPPP
eukprot:6353226-Prymnesium_polylepis.1